MLDLGVSNHVSTLFLFGAGASAFSGASLPTAPPLGAALFDELRALGGVAASVDGHLADEFRRDFEAGMELFRQTRGYDATVFLLEMAKYFARFRPAVGNLYVQLLANMTDTGRRFVVASLNYELMVELAATMIGRQIRYEFSPNQTRSICIIKPHGSCNFLPDVAPRQFYDFSVNIADTSRHSSIMDGPVRIAEDTREVIEFCDRENAVAPAMSLYEQSKDALFCPSFVKGQQAYFRAAAAHARRIFVIGVRVNDRDSHVWMPLAKTAASLFYVGPDASELLAWASKFRRRGVHHFATTFEEAVPKIIDVHAR